MLATLTFGPSQHRTDGTDRVDAVSYVVRRVRASFKSSQVKSSQSKSVCCEVVGFDTMHKSSQVKSIKVRLLRVMKVTVALCKYRAIRLIDLIHNRDVGCTNGGKSSTSPGGHTLLSVLATDVRAAA
jgi:hypothetical protein